MPRRVADIMAGRFRPRSADDEANKPEDPTTLALLGLTLVPDVLAKTPPFVDRVFPDSPAAQAGLQPDDLILFVNNQVVSSRRGFEEELTYIDRIDEVRLTVQRNRELLEFVLRADR